MTTYRAWRAKALKDPEVAGAYIEEMDAELEALREVEKAARDLEIYGDFDTNGTLQHLQDALAKLDALRGGEAK